MFYYVYVLERNDGKFYIGYTEDLKRRVKEHNQGLNVSTKSYRPLECVYYEACRDEDDAKRREKYLKKTQGGRLLKRRLKEYYYKKHLTN